MYTRMKTAQTIGVIGAGTMGAGVAQGCVVAGANSVRTFRRRLLP